MSQSKKIIYVSYTHNKKNDELQHTIEEMFDEIAELPMENRDDLSCVVGILSLLIDTVARLKDLSDSNCCTSGYSISLGFRYTIGS